MGQIELAKAIEALRSELEAARSAGDGKGLRFEVGSVDLELQAAVTAEGGGSAGIKWWLLEGGAEASASRATTQTVKLSLTPKIVDRNGTVQPQTPLLDGRD
ncbi:trypco2 family protein [Myceligenerans xiligouense]|uniref:Trypsin-co-occurring domain-containing protein n=1 Tax=Myceligenerans xiligouense TaxID=253184 RepID=A0A3N4YSC3_9MICO|nr:trypco2 family protein [Myceligenerans xiligouense]RPF21460.1 hypothetical protein EDD34_2089 [Myceligenerans xiligouense]